MINRASQEWPEGTAVEITGEEMQPTTTATEDLLEALKALLDIIPYPTTQPDARIHAAARDAIARAEKEMHAREWLGEAIELIASATAKAIISNIERKPMSQWTKEEMKIYNRLTGQDEKGKK